MPSAACGTILPRPRAATFSLWWGRNRGISGFGNILKDIAGYYGISGCEVPGTKEKRGSPDRRHVYLNAGGDIICYIYRYEYADGSKEFLPWNAANGKTEFPSPRPLYRLPQLMKTDKIILVEGEKCTDALAAAGFAATTLMGGANTRIEKRISRCSKTKTSFCGRTMTNRGGNMLTTWLKLC